VPTKYINPKLNLLSNIVRLEEEPRTRIRKLSISAASERRCGRDCPKHASIQNPTSLINPQTRIPTQPGQLLVRRTPRRRGTTLEQRRKLADSATESLFYRRVTTAGKAVVPMDILCGIYFILHIERLRETIPHYHYIPNYSTSESGASSPIVPAHSKLHDADLHMLPSLVDGSTRTVHYDLRLCYVLTLLYQMVSSFNAHLSRTRN